ncbi:hypothetical protein [Fluviispira vulneris]|uniref:hypothetical protein n=1 Tax=Fluviispira vulneris TaxID=2763012 RepID=UPI001646DC45|nr:hypothetical protein [Fluviispira vulneris]
MSEIELFKTSVPKKIKRFAINNFGVEIIVAESLKKAGIYSDDKKSNNADVVYINNIVFVKKYTKHKADDLSFLILKCLGLAVIHHFKYQNLKITKINEEIQAIGIAFSLAVFLKIRVSKMMIRNLNRLISVDDSKQFFLEF